jgi:hypothetical protein
VPQPVALIAFAFSPLDYCATKEDAAVLFRYIETVRLFRTQNYKLRTPSSKTPDIMNTHSKTLAAEKDAIFLRWLRAHFSIILNELWTILTHSEINVVSGNVDINRK